MKTIEQKIRERIRRMKNRPGIYMILNTNNSKYYIGSSVNTKVRIAEHKRDLKLNRHNNTHLQRAWNKYGEIAFQFKVILHCNKQDLLKYEQYYIDLFKATNDTFGYNKCKIAGNTIGYKWTPEQRQKLSESSKGQIPWNKGKKGIYSQETIAIMRDARLGKSSWNKGIKHTEETKKKMSINGRGRVAWNKGKKMPASVGIKIAEANRNRIWKDESKQKMSKARKGKKLSKQHRQAISNGLKGRTIPEEIKQKISITLKNKKNGKSV